MRPNLGPGACAGAVAVVVLLLVPSGASIPLHPTASAPHLPGRSGEGAQPSLGPAAQSGDSPGASFAAVPTPTGAGPDAVLATTVLANGTASSGFVAPADGLSPAASAWDPATRELWVADRASGAVSIERPGVGLVANVPVGSVPDAVVYDPAGGEVFVANWGTNNVTAVNDATLRVVATIAVGDASGDTASRPTSLAYDPSTGDVYVAQQGRYLVPAYSQNVSVIDGRTNTVVRVFSVGPAPTQVGYDPVRGVLDVWDEGSGAIEFVDPVNGTLNGTLTPTGFPTGFGLDATDGILATTQANGTGATEIVEYTVNRSTGSLLRTVPGVPFGSFGGPLAYDPTMGAFLALVNNTALVEASASAASGTVVNGVGPCLSSLAVDLGVGVVSTDGCNSTVAVRNATSLGVASATVVGSLPGNLLYDPGANALLAGNTAGSSLLTLNASTRGLRCACPLGESPVAFAYAADRSATYVLEASLSGAPSHVVNIADVPDANGTPGAVFSVNVGGEAVTGIAYDRALARLYIVGVAMDNGSLFENLTAIDPGTGTTLGTWTLLGLFPAPALPAGAVATVLPMPGGFLAVSDPWAGDVFGVNGTNGKIVWNAVLGGKPTVLTPYPTESAVAVGFLDRAQVTIVSDTGRNLTTVPLVAPVSGLAFDPLNVRLYLSETTPSGTGVVQSWDQAAGDLGFVRLPVPLGGAAFDAAAGLVAVTGPRNGAVYFLGSALNASNLVPSPTSAIQGVPVNVSSVVTGGFPPYSVAWRAIPSGCVPNGTVSLRCTPPRAGTFRAAANVTDAAGETIALATAVSVAPYPLGPRIGNATATGPTTIGSKTPMQAVVLGPAPGRVAPWTTFSWKAAPAADAEFDRTSGPFVNVTWLAQANVTVTLSASYNGTNSSATSSWNVTPAAAAATPPESGPSALHLNVVELGLIVGALGAAAIALAVWGMRRRSRRKGGAPPADR